MKTIIGIILTSPNARPILGAIACIGLWLTVASVFHRSSNSGIQASHRACQDYITDHLGHLQTDSSSFQTEWPPSSPDRESDHRSKLTSKPYGQECKLTKVSMLYGAHRLPQLELALESHRQHSDRWSCGFTSLHVEISSRKLYSKHYFLMSTMLQELSKPADKRQKWLMWVDADSILINPALSPEIFLPPEEISDIYALVSADHNGLNDGIFYLRVHPDSVDFLTQIVAYPLAHPNEDLGWFGEQRAMSNVIKAIETNANRNAKHSGIAWVPRSWFNTYQFETGFEGQPGNILVHFAGLGGTRIGHMSNWLDELETNPSKWEVELQDTFYKDSVPKFWDEFLANLTAGS